MLTQIWKKKKKKKKGFLQGTKEFRLFYKKG
jgi:hypothetical protein